MNYRLFVYGTLRRQGVRAIELDYPDARWISDGTVSGQLFDLGDYPGLRLGGTAVVGEIFEIGAITLAALDRYEGYYPDNPEHSEYIRKKTSVTLPDGKMAECWTYEIVESRTIGCPVISGGDWIEYAANRAI